MKLRAHAKLNLFLRVKGVLEDGYHELSTVMHEISLFDDVIVEPAEGIHVESGDVVLPEGELNTAYKAAKLYGRGADMRIVKRIPAAAGLGGGSTDAAAVLRALNTHYKLYDEKKLAEIALKIGADVPFSLVGKTALCRNKGEQIIPVKCGKKLWFVLARGERRLLTARVFGEYDNITREREELNQQLLGISLSYFGKRDKFMSEEQAMISALESGDTMRIAKQMKNDLEEAAVSLAPEIWDVKCRLMESGAIRSLMTGSGSVCFGLYEDEDSARQGLEKVAQHVKYARVCCSVL